MPDNSQQQPARRAPGRRLGRIALGVAAVLAIVIVLVLAAGAITRAGLKANYPPPGMLVDLGGYRLHLYCQGSGSPTVILESGLGDAETQWEQVRPQIASTTRTCVYDRAGLGWSDASPNPRTFTSMASELHTLLTRASIAGPYVLVGHSMGGALVRLYAHTYPQAVVGMVLVDASHEDQFARFPPALGQSSDQFVNQFEQDTNRDRPLVALGLVALVNTFQPPDPKLPLAAWKADQSFYGADTKMKDAQVAEAKAFRSNLDQVRAAQITSLGNVPLIVLRHGRADQFFDSALSAQDRQQGELAWQQMQAELVQLSPQGRLVVATESGHYIQLDQPQLVIDAIQQVLAQARH